MTFLPEYIFLANAPKRILILESPQRRIDVLLQTESFWNDAGSYLGIGGHLVGCQGFAAVIKKYHHKIDFRRTVIKSRNSSTYFYLCNMLQIVGK